MAERKLFIGYDHHLAPGDYTILTPLLRDLKTTYGDRYLADVDTTMGALFLNNPNITRLDPNAPDVERVVLGYKQGMDLAKTGEKVHFTNWMYRDFFAKTRIKVPQLKPNCDFHLTDDERDFAPISGRYWLVMGGGKSDFVTKHWDFQWYQDLVNMMRPLGLRFAQTGSSAETHVHPHMNDVLNLVGWGYLRELVWQIAHCEGIICPITCGMHIASAFNKPCVVIAGGREEPWWEAYDNEYKQFGPDSAPMEVTHRYLHTVGELDCCKTHGCWTNKLKLTLKDNNICKKLAPREAGRQPLPLCMDMIQPRDVVKAVMSYYADGTLPPPPTGEIPEPQILADQVPWQPIANQPVETAEEMAPRRAGLRWSHPKLGGKITICAYLEGDNHPDHVRCINSILRTVPRLRLSLHVCTNGVGPETLTHLAESCSFARRYEHADKYPCMWAAFQDVDTKYVAWIESPARIVHNDWLNLLGDCILKQNHDVGMYGHKQVHAFAIPSEPDPRPWLVQRHWYSGVPLLNNAGNPSVEGNMVRYAEDWFFVLKKDAIDRCDIPDETLRVKGEVAIGLQLLQQKYKIMTFNAGKSLVFTPPAEDNPESAAEQRYPWQGGHHDSVRSQAND